MHCPCPRHKPGLEECRLFRSCQLRGFGMLNLSPCDRVAGLTPRAGSTELTSIPAGSSLRAPCTNDLTSPEWFLEPVWEQQWIIPVQFDFADAESHSAVVEDIIPRIRGGDTTYSGGLLNSWDGKMYRYWGRSLKYNPAVIDFQVRLFCS